VSKADKLGQNRIACLRSLTDDEVLAIRVGEIIRRGRVSASMRSGIQRVRTKIHALRLCYIVSRLIVET
jgi:hypothetical protein